MSKLEKWSIDDSLYPSWAEGCEGRFGDAEAKLWYEPYGFGSQLAHNGVFKQSQPFDFDDVAAVFRRFYRALDVGGERS